MGIHKVLHVHQGCMILFYKPKAPPSGPIPFLKSLTEQNKGNC